MKVKFPVLIKNRPQFITFLEFLERNEVAWRDGEKATCYLDSDSDGFFDLTFPVYILYWDYEKYKESIPLWRLRPYRYITYLNEDDEAEDWFEENFHCNDEIEFENE